jgi:hypothetical protein
MVTGQVRGGVGMLKQICSYVQSLMPGMESCGVLKWN